MDRLSIGTKVRHPQYGVGMVERVEEYSYVINFQSRGRVDVSRKFAGLEVEEEDEFQENGPYETSEIERAIEKVLRKWGEIGELAELGEKWEGGTLILQPANPDLKPKEIPVETFFHKIVMLRDRLRVLEQNINSHAKLTDEDKVNLQQYITRTYGSLTTFNVLFKDKKDYFVGEKGKE